MKITGTCHAMLFSLVIGLLVTPAGAGANEGAPPPDDAALRRLQSAERSAREVEATRHRADPELARMQAQARVAQAKAAREREQRKPRGK